MFLRILFYFSRRYLLNKVLLNFANVLISMAMSSSLYSLSAVVYPTARLCEFSFYEMKFISLFSRETKTSRKVNFAFTE